MLRDKLVKLLEIIGVRKEIEEELDNILQGVSEHEGVDFDTLKKIVDVDLIMESIINGTLHVFSEEELDAAITFMSSREGRSFTDKMDQFSDVANSISLTYITDILNDFFSPNKDEKDDGGDGSGGAGGYKN